MDRHEQWRVETNNMGTVELVADGENGEEWLIASASFGPLAVRQKNFALLRAAPDLLEALTEIESLARGAVTVNHTRCLMAINLIIDSTFAAIAKATGDQ